MIDNDHPNDKTVSITEYVKKRGQRDLFPNVKKIASGMSLKVHDANNVAPKPQPWLWDPYIPLETCTLFAGAGGIGKSQLLLYLCGLVSNGADFSINSLPYHIDEGKVLILSAEDNLESSIIPRLKAVDAKLSNITIAESTFDDDMDKTERFIALDNDLALVETLLAALGNVRLIIIDPVTAYLGKVRENQSAEVRNFILRISRMAERFKLAVILNTHTRKKASGESNTGARDEIMGSSAWYNTVRQAFTISQDHENPERILFINCKSNCGAKPEAFDYQIESADVIFGDEIIKTSRVNLLSGKVAVTADEALNQDKYDKRVLLDEAKKLILRELSFGAKSAQRMFQVADREDITTSTLKRARQALTKEGINIIMEPSQTDRRKMIWYIGTDKK